MAGLKVGEEGCSYIEVMHILLATGDWKEGIPITFPMIVALGIALEIPTGIVDHLKFTRNAGATDTDALHSVLINWRSKFASKATIQKLVNVLQDLDLNDTAEKLYGRFIGCTHRNIETHYDLPPRELMLFRNSDNRILILCTRDKLILEQRIRETNIPRTVFFNSEKALEKIIWTPPKHDEVFVVTCTRKVAICLPKLVGIGTKIVLITEENSNDVLQDKQIFPKCIVSEDKLSWDDLTEPFQHELKERSIKIQNNVLPFKTVLAVEDSEDGIEVEEGLLIDIINNREPSLVSSMIPDSVSYYIPRRISPRSLLRESHIFREGDNGDTFVFTGIQRRELTLKANPHSTDKSSDQLKLPKIKVRYMTLTQKSDFKEISQEIKSPVHWVHHENGKFSWIKSSGNMTSIHQAIDVNQNAKIRLSEEDFLSEIIKVNEHSNSKQPICISDTPGMGKSLLLANLGGSLAKLPSNKLILYFDCSEFILKLQAITGKTKGVAELKTAVESVLLDIPNAEKTGKLFIQKTLTSGTMEIEIMFDGFDEVPSEDKELAKKCLASIQSFPSARVWVTTRPHLLHELENCLQSLGYHINPFNFDDQTNILVLYWSQNTKKLDLERLETFAKTNLQTLKESLSNTENDIAGIPLQCMLIAIVLQKSAVQYSDLENCPSNLDIPKLHFGSITKLFESMIETKLQPNFKRYSSTNNLTEEKIKNAHALLSLQLLFPDIAKSFENILEMDLKEVIPALVKVGLLLEISVDGVPRFIHRTVAEFFVAWFSNQLIQKGATDRNTNPLFSAIFQSINFKFHIDIPTGIIPEHLSTIMPILTYAFKHPVICHFLDNMIQLEPGTKYTPNFRHDFKTIHSCVRSNLPQLFDFIYGMKKLEEEEPYIFDKDLILVAVRYSSSYLFSEVSEIYERFRKRKVRDIVFGDFTVLHVAVRYRDYSIVDHLVNKNEFMEIIVSRPESCQRLIHFCVESSLHDMDNMIEEKIETLSLIVGLNKSLLENQDLGNVNADSYPPLLCKSINFRLQQKMIDLGADLLQFRGRGRGNILHIWAKELTPEDCQFRLSQMPFEFFNILAKQRFNGSTPLDMILRKFSPSPDTWRLFQEAGIIEENGVELLNSVIQQKLRSQSNEGFKTFVELVERGANFKHTEPNGMTLVHKAVTAGHFPLFKYIALKWADDATLIALLTSAIAWADMKCADLSSLGLNWNVPSPTILQSILQNRLITDHKRDIIEMVRNNGAGVAKYDFDRLDGLDLESLIILESIDGIKSDENVYKCLLHMVKYMEILDDESCAVPFENLLNKWSGALSVSDRDGNSLLHHAVLRNNIVVVQLLLKHGADAHAKNSELKSPLEFGFDEIQEFQEEFLGLIRAEIISELNSYDAITSADIAFLALRNIVIAMSAETLSKSANLADSLIKKFGEGILEVKDKNTGDFLLHCFSSQGNIEGVEYLLSKGADVNEVNEIGNTALHVAVKWNRESIAECLLNHGADVTIQNTYNLTPLHEALQNNLNKTVELILSARGFDSTSTAKFMTSLRIIDELPLETFSILYDWYIRVFNSEPNYESERKEMHCFLLKWAAERGDGEIFEFLLEKDDNLLFQESMVDFVHGVVSPTQFMLGHCVIILKLIARRNSSLLDAQDKNGRTPILMPNIEFGHLLWLLKNVRNPRAVDANGRNVALTAVHYLNSSKYQTLLETIVEIGCGDMLLARDEQDKATVLHHAVSKFNVSIEMLNLFQENKAHFDAIDGNGKSVLTRAVERITTYGEEGFLATLVTFVEDPNAVDSQGRNALHLACSRLNDGAVNVLVNYCNVNAQDAKGNTPLHIVASTNWVDPEITTPILQSLLSNGASKVTRNGADHRPYDIIVNNNRIHTFEREELKKLLDPN